MSATSRPADVVQARREARWGLGAIATLTLTGGALVLAYRVGAVGILCPFWSLTGWWCPLCGGTRMAASLMTGDVAAAFHWNPLAFIVVALVIARGVGWAVELAGGPTVRPAKMGWLRGVSGRGWVVVGCAVAVGWTVLRNTVSLY